MIISHVIYIFWILFTYYSFIFCSMAHDWWSNKLWQDYVLHFSVLSPNMLLLIDNILPHKTCLKLRGMIINKCANFILFISTHGAPTLVYFCINVWLNKDIVVGCPCGSDDMWVIVYMVEYTFVRVFSNMSSKFVKNILTNMDGM